MFITREVSRVPSINCPPYVSLCGSIRRRIVTFINARKDICPPPSPDRQAPQKVNKSGCKLSRVLQYVILALLTQHDGYIQALLTHNLRKPRVRFRERFFLPFYNAS